MLALAIEKFGTANQKSEWLPKLASGEVRGGLALTEPDAGTDLQGIRMTARRNGDNYVINGAKTWITNAVEGSCFALLVKTNPEAQPRHKGMSLFIAPKGPGFSSGRKLEKLGYKSIDSGELIADSYVLSTDLAIYGRHRVLPIRLVWIRAPLLADLLEFGMANELLCVFGVRLVNFFLRFQ